MFIACTIFNIGDGVRLQPQLPARDTGPASPSDEIARSETRRTANRTAASTVEVRILAAHTYASVFTLHPLGPIGTEMGNCFWRFSAFPHRSHQIVHENLLLSSIPSLCSS